ncbi:hypothetical protein LSAT2_008358 [Lamellibrachia satsuma]|nr:hypothetical protein LSAT2_008358 [Lamellibrachia satsuma]
MQGIDVRLSKRAMFGKGSYFCESSTKADQYADHKHQRTTGPHSMFLVRVILGHSHIAKKPDDMNRPPCKYHCNDSCKHVPNEFYDSVMGTHRDGGNRLIFREFITYEKSQSYPAYLITYDRK